MQGQIRVAMVLLALSVTALGLAGCEVTCEESRDARRECYNEWCASDGGWSSFCRCRDRGGYLNLYCECDTLSPPDEELFYQLCLEGYVWEDNITDDCDEIIDTVLLGEEICAGE